MTCYLEFAHSFTESVSFYSTLKQLSTNHSYLRLHPLVSIEQVSGEVLTPVRGHVNI